MSTPISQAASLEGDPHWIEYRDHVQKRIDRNDFRFQSEAAEEAFKLGVGLGYEAGARRPRPSAAIVVELSPTDRQLLRDLRGAL